MGLLRVSEERAAGLAHAACTGAVLTFLDTPDSARDMNLAIATREAVVAAMTRAAPPLEPPGPYGAAIARRASLGQAAIPTPGERHLLGELPDRIAQGESGANP